MKTTIGVYAAATRDVPVKFESGEIVHERRVNACHDSTGTYDAEATAQRVTDVARGVAAKIAVGAIVNVPELEELAHPVEAAEPTGE